MKLLTALLATVLVSLHGSLPNSSAPTSDLDVAQCGTCSPLPINGAAFPPTGWIGGLIKGNPTGGACDDAGGCCGADTTDPYEFDFELYIWHPNTVSPTPDPKGRATIDPFGAGPNTLPTLDLPGTPLVVNGTPGQYYSLKAEPAEVHCGVEVALEMFDGMPAANLGIVVLTCQACPNQTCD